MTPDSIIDDQHAWFYFTRTWATADDPYYSPKMDVSKYKKGILQIILSGNTGAVSLTIDVKGSNDGSNFLENSTQKVTTDANGDYLLEIDSILMGCRCLRIEVTSEAGHSSTLNFYVSLKR